MGSKNLFLTTLLVMFVLFLSTISLVFGLSGGMFIFELLVLGFFMFVAFILMIGLYFDGGWVWPGMLMFFSLNMLNGVFLMFKGSTLRELVLLAIASLLGFVIAATRKKCVCEDYNVEQEVVEVEEEKPEPKKKAKKKAKKKTK